MEAVTMSTENAEYSFTEKLMDVLREVLGPEKRQEKRIKNGLTGFWWGCLFFAQDSVYGAVFLAVRLLVNLFSAMTDMAVQRYRVISGAIERESRWYVRYPMYASYIFVPFAFLYVPVGLAAMAILVCFFVDQITYPSFHVNPAFMSADNQKLSQDRKSALIFQSAVHQLEKELDSPLGWTPNDRAVSPAKFFDNRLNRQLGVINATQSLVTSLSMYFTNYGHGDDEDPNTYGGAKSLSFDVDYWNWWVMGDTEEIYKGALNKIKRYIDEAYAADGKKRSNIKTDDLYNMLGIVRNQVMRVPLGRLQGMERPLKWEELDDAVYYSQGSAIVVRDFLCALRSCYHDVLVKGSEDNLARAINTLNEIIDTNPWCVFRGKDRYMAAPDTRANFGAAYNIVDSQLNVVMNALRI